jgi:hypothetical protein
MFFSQTETVPLIDTGEFPTSALHLLTLCRQSFEDASQPFPGPSHLCIHTCNSLPDLSFLLISPPAIRPLVEQTSVGKELARKRTPLIPGGLFLIPGMDAGGEESYAGESCASKREV